MEPQFASSQWKKKILTAIFIQVPLSLLYVTVAWFFWLWSPEETTEGQRKVELFIFKSNILEMVITKYTRISNWRTIQQSRQYNQVYSNKNNTTVQLYKYTHTLSSSHPNSSAT